MTAKPTAESCESSFVFPKISDRFDTSLLPLFHKLLQITNHTSLLRLIRLKHPQHIFLKHLPILCVIAAYTVNDSLRLSIDITRDSCETLLRCEIILLGHIVEVVQKVFHFVVASRKRLGRVRRVRR